MKNEQPYSKEAYADTEDRLKALSEYVQKNNYGDWDVIVNDGKGLERAREWWQTEVIQDKLQGMAKEEADALHVEFERLNQNVVDALKALNAFKKEKLGAE